MNKHENIERERIEQFNKRVDYLLTQGEMPLDTPSLTDDLEIAQILARTNLSEESQQLEAIRQHLLDMAARPKANRKSIQTHKIRRVFATTAAALVVMTLVIGVVPPLRILAQDILRQIGVITITNDPTYYDEYSTRPTPDPFSTPITDAVEQVYEMRHLTVEEANSALGFNMSVAGYVPSGYALDSRDVWQKNGLNSVTTFYYDADKDDGLSIAQTIYDLNDASQSREFPVGDALTEDVAVRGSAGLWAADVTTWPPDATISMLFWQEGDYTYMMQSDKLSRSEMLKIAESLVAS